MNALNSLCNMVGVVNNPPFAITITGSGTHNITQIVTQTGSKYTITFTVGSNQIYTNKNINVFSVIVVGGGGAGGYGSNAASGGGGGGGGYGVWDMSYNA